MLTIMKGLKKEKKALNKRNLVFSPASKEQENFLNCDEVDFAFYGGEYCASV